MYRSFDSSMIITSKTVSFIASKRITTIDMYKCKVSIKLSHKKRCCYKEDNLLKAVTHLGSMNNYINNNNNK